MSIDDKAIEDLDWAGRELNKLHHVISDLNARLRAAEKRADILAERLASADAGICRARSTLTLDTSYPLCAHGHNPRACPECP